MGSILDNVNGTKQGKQGRGHVLLVSLSVVDHLNPFLHLLYSLDAECPGLIVTTAAPLKTLEADLQSGHRGDLRSIDLRVEDIACVIPKYDKEPKFSASAGLISEQNYRETEPLRKKLIAQKNGNSGVVPTSSISDMFCFWCKDFADELGIPWYTHFSCYSNPTLTLTILEHHKVIKAGVGPRTAANKTDDQLLLAAVPDHVSTTGLSFVRTSDVPPECYADPEIFIQTAEATAKTAGLILNTAEELDASNGAVWALEKLLGPSRVLSVGPFLQVPGFGRAYSSVPTDAVLPSWLNSQRRKSVLYVAFGTVGIVSEGMVSELAAGLEASSAPFLWVLRVGPEKLSAVLPAGFEEPNCGRGLIVTDYAPQTTILQHPAVGGFVTPCGWNSILEGICSSVRFLAWPLSAEQPVSARYLHAVAKVGVLMAYLKDRNKHTYDDITRKEMELAIIKLFSEEEGHQLRAKLNVEEMQSLAMKTAQRGSSSNKSS